MVDSDGESDGSEDEFYKQVKQKKEAKRVAKAEIYSREPTSTLSLPESVDGKRLVSREIMNKRALTPRRNKDKKNPRKNYRDKYGDKVMRNRGRVKGIRKPSGSYGGEGSATGGAAAPSHPSQNFPATLSQDGRFIQYDIYGNVFEVTAKYTPPITRLGQGAYGIVCSAKNSATDEIVAIKKIRNAFANNIGATRTLREIKILRHMEHGNVIQIKDIIPPPVRNAFHDVYIAYEVMESDLHNIIIDSRQNLSEDHCKYFLYQILRGLKYIHSANVLHRDLKPSNLLVNKNCDLKICDFGLARVKNAFKMTELVVTLWYRAPELLLETSDYTAAIDVWSVGCIFMELMNRKPLFRGKDHGGMLRLVLKLIGTPSEEELEFLNEDAKRCIRQLPTYPRQSIADQFPNVQQPSAIDLIEKMLTFDPRRRITVFDALAHPYLSDLHDINDEPECTTPLDLDYVEYELSKEHMKELIYSEAHAFNPEYQQ